MAKLSLKDKMKRLRPFVTFNYDLRRNLNQTLSPSQKAEITRYYTKVSDGVTQKHVVYRPKTTANIKKARAFTGQKLSKMKAYAIPSPTGGGSVKWRAGEALIEKKGAFVRTINLNMKRLIDDTRPYLNEKLDNGKLYIINSGNDWRGGGTKRAVIEKLVAVIDGGISGPLFDDPEDPEFTISVIEVDTKNQQQFKTYKEKRHDAQKDRNKTARKTRSRDNRKRRDKRGKR